MSSTIKGLEDGSQILAVESKN